MTVWILVAIVGGLLAAVGFLTVVRKYRSGEVRGRYLLAVGIACLSLASYATLSALVPMRVDSVVALVLLAPGLLAIAVLVYEHEKTSAAGRSTR